MLWYLIRFEIKYFLRFLINGCSSPKKCVLSFSNWKSEPCLYVLFMHRMDYVFRSFLVFCRSFENIYSLNLCIVGSFLVLIFGIETNKKKNTRMHCGASLERMNIISRESIVQLFVSFLLHWFWLLDTCRLVLLTCGLLFRLSFSN